MVDERFIICANYRSKSDISTHAWSNEGKKEKRTLFLEPFDLSTLWTFLTLIQTTGVIAQSHGSVDFYTHICLTFSRYFLLSLKRSRNDNFYLRT